MVIIYHNINHRKSRIYVNFSFHAQTLVAILKVKFQDTFFQCVWLRRRALLNFSESLKPKRSDVLIIKVILFFYLGCVPFITTCSQAYLGCFISTKRILL